MIRNKIKIIFHLLKDSTGRLEFAQKLKLFFWPVLRWVAFYYRRTIIRKVKLIVVIGSLGKTTTTKAIEMVINKNNIKSFCTNRYGFIAYSILRISPFANFEIFEVGIDAPGNMEKMGKMLLPDYVVFTSVGLDHLPDFDGIKHIRDEKAKMFNYIRNGGQLFVNGDDENILIKAKQSDRSFITYGLLPHNEIRCIQYSIKLPEGMQCEIKWKDENFTVHTKLFGEKMVYPVLAAIGIGKVLKFKTNEILGKIKELKPAHGRLQVGMLNNKTIVIGDFYKATVDSLQSGFNLVEKIPAKRKIIFLGDIGYLRGNFDETCIKYGKKIGRIFTHAVFIGEMEHALKNGVIRGGMKKENVFLSENSWRKGISALPENLDENDLIYISGRVHQKMERAYLWLKGVKVRCRLKSCKMYSYCQFCNRKDILQN